MNTTETNLETNQNAAEDSGIEKTLSPSATLATSPHDFPDLIWEYGDNVEVTWAAQYLLDRAIAPEVAEARGYFVPERPHLWAAADGKAHHVSDADFKLSWDGIKACRPLAIPLYVSGYQSPSTVQIRPENPMMIDAIVKDGNGRPIIEQVKTRKQDPEIPAIPAVDAVLAAPAIPGVDGQPGTPAVRARAAKPAVAARPGRISTVLEKQTKVEKNSLKFALPAGILRGLSLGDLPSPDILPATQGLLDSREPENLPAIITEGAHKSDAMTSAAWRTGRELASLTLTGVTMGFHAGSSKENPSRHAILTAGMKEIEWEGRRTFLAWDPDWRSNPMVASALITLGQLLEEEGAIVRIIDVPAEDGIGGVDDFIAIKGDEAFFELVASAIDLADAERESRTYERTDDGRADRIADEMKSGRTKYKFNLTSKGALRWDGMRWIEDENGSILNDLAGKLARRDMEDTESRSKRSLEAAVGLAKTRTGVSVTSSDLDTQTDWLNTPAGEYDLRTGTLYPHRQESMNTKLSAVAPDFDSPTPLWNKFLNDVTKGDEELAEYMQAVAGSMLYGRSFTSFCILIGPGNDGKTTFQGAISEMLGDDFTATLGADSLARLTDEATASLRGKRLLAIAESSQRGDVDDGLIKSLSSSDPMTARELYGKRFTMVPSHTPIMSTNHGFSLSDSGRGLWRRLRFVPFLRSFSDAEADPEFSQKLRGELPGILAWAIRGSKQFAENNWKFPHAEAVVRETGRHRAKADPLAQFIEDYLVLDVDARCSRTEVHNAHTLWAGMMNPKNRGWSLAALAEGLIEREVLQRNDYEVKTRTARMWKGVRLRNPQDPQYDDDLARAEIEKMVGESRREVGDWAAREDLAQRQQVALAALIPAEPRAPEPARSSVVDWMDADFG